MVKASSSKSKKKEEDKNVERTRLKNLAIRKKLIADNPAKGFTPLGPNKQVVKHHGKDIIRKSSQRKNRFLFSFPGLLAPTAGGKIGDLKDLGTQNPILYLDFPQGRMKLFGTIVYPENRYLTLQFSRGGKNVMCEDYFDNMILFSDAWWIGKKDENPDEARLEFPKELSEGQHLEYDFKGGAGEAPANKQCFPEIKMKDLEQCPEAESENEYSDVEKKLKEEMEMTPVRHSERTAGKKFKFTENSSEDDPDGSDADICEREEKKTANPVSVVLDFGSEADGYSKEIQTSTEPVSKTEKSSKSAVVVTKSKEDSRINCSSLVQATISTLFKKVEEKNNPNNSRKSSTSKASGQKLHHNDSKSKVDQAKVPRKRRKVIKEKSTGTRNTGKKKKCEVEDDDIEEFSTTPQDTDGSDEDWTA